MIDKPLKKLISGFKEFHKESYELNPEHMSELIKNGQFPDAFVIACSDSRSCPENIFGAEPGEIFVGRHIAALVPEYNSLDVNDTITAAIEFAVDFLEVKRIIIVGHTYCGGIAALADGMKDGAIGCWVQRANEIKNTIESKNNKPLSNDEFIKAMEQESIIWSLNNLKKYPYVEKAMQEDRLQIHGWQFDMEHGLLLEYNENDEIFTVIAGNNDSIAGNQCCGGKKSVSCCS